MTTTDNTWAIRIEAPGLEDVVTGPLTRATRRVEVQGVPFHVCSTCAPALPAQPGRVA